MKLNANISALNALASIQRVNSKLAASSIKLSSGIKITSAKDDASGLAISNKLKNQIRGVEMATRNSMNGISIVQIADGALSSIHNALQRMRELSVRAANETLEPEDRATIQSEIEELADEINKTSKQTEYNKISLLSGIGSEKIFASRITGNGEILTESSYRYQLLSYPQKMSEVYDHTDSETPEFTFPNPALAGTITMANDLGSSTVTFSGQETTAQAFAKMQRAFDSIGIDIDRDSNSNFIISGVTAQQSGSKYNLTEGISSSNDALLYTLGAHSAIAQTQGTNADIRLIPSTEDAYSQFSDSATWTSDGNVIQVKDSNGSQIKLTIPSADMDTNEDLVLKLQTGANKDLHIDIVIPKINIKTLGLNKLDLLTTEGAQNTLDRLDRAVSIISATRAKIGAYQNRLEQTVSNLDINLENMQTSLSRIYDTNVATEMTEYTKNQVISQAGISILSQANQRPQQILQLLQ